MRCSAYPFGAELFDLAAPDPVASNNALELSPSKPRAGTTVVAPYG